MAVIQDADGTDLHVDATFGAARSSLWPLDHGVHGQYGVSVASGLMASLAGAAPVFSLRWTDSAKFFVLLQFKAAYQTITAFSSANEIGSELVVARSFTASDTAGTALTLSGDNAKKRTNMPTTLVGDARIATTAALTAGTRTLDTQGIASVVNMSPLAQTGLVYTTAQQEHPVILAQNEGLVLRNLIAFGASGTVRLHVLIQWAEVSAY